MVWNRGERKGLTGSPKLLDGKFWPKELLPSDKHGP